ncbi:hypothetical protein [Bacteroides stercorirosoris]|nr:hypothetical protein [Bacteroides stercorirosoris]
MAKLCQCDGKAVPMRWQKLANAVARYRHSNCDNPMIQMADIRF